jgi:hypothetical protein
MDYNDIVTHYGSAAQAAEKLGVGATALANWKARGFVPLGTQALIQIKTRGRLKMDQPEEERR